MLTQMELQSILPQAYPFLMIDRILEIKKGESLMAIKNITGNEWIFQNQHFQIDHLPEPFLIEAAAQAALVLYAMDVSVKGGVKFLGKCKAEFYERALLGDQLMIGVSIIKLLKNLGFFHASLSAGPKKIADIEIICGVGG